MSDGNFNRSLLPKGELSTGIKVGKAQMRTKAIDAFCDILNREEFADLTAEQKQALEYSFREKLR